jgi:hypothetical protein
MAPHRTQGEGMRDLIRKLTYSASNLDPTAQTHPDRQLDASISVTDMSGHHWRYGRDLATLHLPTTGHRGAASYFPATGHLGLSRSHDPSPAVLSSTSDTCLWLATHSGTVVRGGISACVRRCAKQPAMLVAGELSRGSAHAEQRILLGDVMR